MKHWKSELGRKYAKYGELNFTDSGSDTLELQEHLRPNYSNYIEALRAAKCVNQVTGDESTYTIKVDYTKGDEFFKFIKAIGIWGASKKYDSISFWGWSDDCEGCLGF